MRVETTYEDKPVVMYGISLASWSTWCGKFFIRERVYRNGAWTPYIKYYKRYST